MTKKRSQQNKDLNELQKNIVPSKIKSKNSGNGIRKTFRNIISQTKKHMHKLKPKCKKAAIDLAFAAAKEFTSDLPINIPRVIPVPKTGGILPLIPIFAGLSAAGSLAGGAAGIAKAIKAIKSAKERLQELKRHNHEMEALCIGRGLQLKPYKNGLGIYPIKSKN